MDKLPTLPANANKCEISGPPQKPKPGNFIFANITDPPDGMKKETSGAPAGQGYGPRPKRP